MAERRERVRLVLDDAGFVSGMRAAAASALTLDRSRVLVRRPIWIAWYPLRSGRCSARFTRHTRPGDPERDGWHAHLAIGPLYVAIGPGVPAP